VLIFDEIKTAFRLAIGGAVERYEVRPPPIWWCSAKRSPTDFLSRSSAGEQTSWRREPHVDLIDARDRGRGLAAARATLDVFERDDVCGHLHRVGMRLLHGLHQLQRAHSAQVTGVAGIPRCVSCTTRGGIVPASGAGCGAARAVVQKNRVQLRLARPR